MKINFDHVKRSFDDSIRRANCQEWETLSRFAERRESSADDLDHEDFDIDLGFDVDEELKDEEAGGKVSALSDKISQAVTDLVRWPSRRICERLRKLDAKEVLIPAGCDPGSPAEIQSAFKRAIKRCDAFRYTSDYTLLIPAGSQDWFFDALDGDQPATILGINVRLVPCIELLDQSELDKAIPAEGVTPQQYLQAVHELAKATPWYVLPSYFAFSYIERKRPELVGPKLSIKASLGLRLDSCAAIVRVQPSKLVLAQTTPELIKL